jgi:hypothetical protein
MLDLTTTSRTARERLQQALGALQQPGVPPQLMDVAEPVAAAMGELFKIERSQGAAAAECAPVALQSVRRALSMLQAQPYSHPAVDMAVEAIAGSLNLVHQLTQAAAQAAPQQQAYQPPQQQAYQPPQQQAYQPPQQPQQPAAPPWAQQQGVTPGGATVLMPPGQDASPYVHNAPRPAPAAAPGGTVALPPQAAAAYGQQQPARPAAAPQAYQPQPAARPTGGQPQYAAPTVEAAPPYGGWPAAQPPAQPPQPAAWPAAQPPAQPPQPAAWPAAQPPAQPPQPAAWPAAQPPAQPPQPAGWPPAQPAPAWQAPQAQAAPVEGHGTPIRIEAELGAHSQTNFYKGLSGNDVIESGGIFVATYQIPKLNQNVLLKISLPGGYEFEAMGVVRWTRDARNADADAPPGFGAQFTQVSPEGRQLVYRYVRNREPLFHDDL